MKGNKVILSGIGQKAQLERPMVASGHSCWAYPHRLICPVAQGRCRATSTVGKSSKEWIPFGAGLFPWVVPLPLLKEPCQDSHFWHWSVLGVERSHTFKCSSVSDQLLKEHSFSSCLVRLTVLLTAYHGKLCTHVPAAGLFIYYFF